MKLLFNVTTLNTLSITNGHKIVAIKIFDVSLTSYFLSYRFVIIRALEPVFSHPLLHRRWGKNCLSVKIVEEAIHTEETYGDT